MDTVSAPTSEMYLGDPVLDPFRRFDLEDFLEAAPPPLDYVMDGILEAGELTWLSGRGKVGKSMLALFLMDACLSGRETFLGRAVKALDWGLYIDAENREATVRRRVHLAGMSREAAARIDYRSVRGVDLGSDLGVAALRELIANKRGRGLVILDSLVALHRVDSNVAEEVRWFVDRLREVFEQHEVTAIGLAHENRGGDMRGSLDWRNAVDRVIDLKKKENGERTLSNGDVRDGPDDDEGVTFKFATILDQYGRTRLSMELLDAGTIRPRGKADQLAAEIVLLLRGDSKLTKAATARNLGYAPDHGTFRSAWTRASAVLASDA